MKVPFGTLNVNDKDLLDKVVASNWLTNGPTVLQLEQEFAKRFGSKYAIACSTGTDALAICCAMLPRGKEVICPALTFVATANAILQGGLKPVFVDVNRQTLGIDVKQIEKAITRNTVAIMPVHLMGKPCDMDQIMKLAKKYKLEVIEDCCEAHMAEYKGKAVGLFGGMGCFSMYASHIVSSVEGGMIITNSSYVDEMARSLRNHGMINKFQFQFIGFSAKMNELEAAVGLGNIMNFDSILNHRIRNFKYLSNHLARYKDYFDFVCEEEGYKIAPHAFSIICRWGVTKNMLCKALKEAEIDYRDLFYSIPTQTLGYKQLGYKGKFPNAEYCSDNGVHIGIHQDLTIAQLDYVVSVIKRLVDSC